jgi:hypothetical protein
MIIRHPKTFQEDLGNLCYCRLSVFFLNFVMTVIPLVTKAEPISAVMILARLITTVNVFVIIKGHSAFNYIWIN